MSGTRPEALADNKSWDTGQGKQLCGTEGASSGGGGLRRNTHTYVLLTYHLVKMSGQRRDLWRCVSSAAGGQTRPLARVGACDTVSSNQGRPAASPPVFSIHQGVPSNLPGLPERCHGKALHLAQARAADTLPPSRPLAICFLAQSSPHLYYFPPISHPVSASQSTLGGYIAACIRAANSGSPWDVMLSWHRKFC